MNNAGEDMEWKITEHSDGTVTLAYGEEHKGGALSPIGMGYTMPYFFSYFEGRFNNIREAKKYIKSHPNPLK